jgi:hypothetical protein
MRVQCLPVGAVNALRLLAPYNGRHPSHPANTPYIDNLAMWQPTPSLVCQISTEITNNLAT